MNILVIQLGTLGDMILTTPMFRAVADKYPEAKIDVLAGRRNHNIIRNNPYINKIIVHQKSPMKILPYIFKLRNKRYDWLIDHKDHISKEGRLLAKIIKSKKKIGFNGCEKIYDYSIPSDIENKDKHFVIRLFNALEPLGIKKPDGYIKPEIFPPEDSRRFAENYIKENNLKRIVIINISAGSEERIIKSEKWLEIIEQSNLNGFNILINNTSEQKSICDEIIARRPDIYAFPARNIMDVSAMVKRSELVVTPDTSLVHIAAAYDTNLVGIFADIEKPFNRKKFLPLSQKHRIIFAENNIINSINPEDVSRAINSFL